MECWCILVHGSARREGLFRAHRGNESFTFRERIQRMIVKLTDWSKPPARPAFIAMKQEIADDVEDRQTRTIPARTEESGDG
jgi:hypothetical protein